MIVFNDLQLNDTAPIYWQILQHIKIGIVSGSIQDGDELPSRRTVSALLGINPNTVQKAYAVLEEEGLIASRMGAKSTMILNDAVRRRIRDELTLAVTQRAVTEFKELGLDLSAVLELICKQWKEESL